MLYNELGCDTVEIAKFLHVHNTTVRARLLKMGHKLRKPARRNGQFVSLNILPEIIKAVKESA